MAASNRLLSVIFRPQQGAQLEIDTEGEDGRDPNRRKNRLLLVFYDKPEISRNDKRQHHRRDNKII
jgi:hypothetical protein